MIVEEGKYYLYRHIREDKNLPFYIGIGTKPSWNGSCKETIYTRAYNTDRRNAHWKNITNKYKYRVEILLESNDSNFIKQKEIEFVSLYGRVNDGGILCNITTGGDGTHGFSRTPEINKLIGFKNSGKLNKKSIPTYKYNSNGEYIEEYDSLNLAAKYNNLKKQNVIASKDRGIKCGGFYWSDVKYDNFIKGSPKYLSKTEMYKINGLKLRKIKGQITAFNVDGTIFKEFDCIDDATLFFTNKFPKRPNRNLNIEHNISGKYELAYGYKWKWKNELFEK